ncbi:hypothetical protein Tco_0575411 [Tanacetum coccineum]
MGSKCLALGSKDQNLLQQVCVKETEAYQKRPFGRLRIATYKQKMGLDIDPKLKYECQKDLNDGDSLMEDGKLKDAIPFYVQLISRDIVDPYTVGTAGASGIRNWGKLYADPVGTQYLNAEPVSTLTLAELKKKQLAKETDEKEYELVVDRRV